MKKRACTVAMVLLFPFLIALTLGRAAAQTQQITPEQREELAKASRAEQVKKWDAFLAHRGQLKNKEDIKAFVIATKLAEKPSAEWIQWAEIRWVDLAMQGFTVPRIKKLKQKGIDVIQSVLPESGKQPSTVDLAIRSELVVVGEVKEVVYTYEPGDGYRSGVVITVKEVLKGVAPGIEIAIRQATGKVSTGGEVQISTDLVAKKGEIYLLFLSNAWYRYYLEFPWPGAEKVRSDIPESVKRKNFVRAGEAFELRNGKLLRVHDFGSRIPITEDLESTLRAIRDVARIMKAVK